MKLFHQGFSHMKFAVSCIGLFRATQLFRRDPALSGFLYQANMDYS